jgi:hypothetical protein
MMLQWCEPPAHAKALLFALEDLTLDVMEINFLLSTS